MKSAFRLLSLAALAVTGGHASADVLVPAGQEVTVSPTEITRILEPNANSPYIESLAVPPGYTTFYISGTNPPPMIPAQGRAGEPGYKAAVWGDIFQQTESLLELHKKNLAKMGLTFGDVIQAHVFMAPDPAANQGIRFADMNSVWLKYFGTAGQPNKPARSTFKVASLAAGGSLLEVEFIAVKKIDPKAAAKKK